MKILGYLAPHDMFEGKVKKGDLYVRSQSVEEYYAFEAKKGILFYHLPAEIVTRWEAKFEQTEAEEQSQMWTELLALYLKSADNLETTLKNQNKFKLVRR